MVDHDLDAMSDGRLDHVIRELARDLDAGVTRYEALLEERERRSFAAATPASPRPVADPPIATVPPATRSDVAQPNPTRDHWDVATFEPWAERQARRQSMRVEARA